jgi:hypothetical protein
VSREACGRQRPYLRELRYVGEQEAAGLEKKNKRKPDEANKSSTNVILDPSDTSF